MDTIASRVLGWTAVDDAAQRGTKLRAAWIVVSLHIAVRLTLSLYFGGYSRALLPLPALLFAAGLWRPLARPAAVLLTLIQGGRFAASYPDVSNHYLVECLCVLTFAVCDLTREDERVLCLGVLRWLVVLVFVMSGLQKCLHGAYFKGQYLAYMVANDDRFRSFFRPLLSTADLSHLGTLRRAVDQLQFHGSHLMGALPGPYRVHSVLFVAVANAIWLGEIGLALGLLWPRVRSFALVGAVVMLAGIFAASNELLFDTLFLNLMLLFARRDLAWRLLPLTLASYGYYLLVGFGVVHGSVVW